MKANIKTGLLCVAVFLSGYLGATTLDLPRLDGTIKVYDHGNTAMSVIVDWICQNENSDGGWADCGSQKVEIPTDNLGGEGFDLSHYSLPALSLNVGDRNILRVSFTTYSGAVNNEKPILMLVDEVSAATIDDAEKKYEASLRYVSLYSFTIQPPKLTLSNGQDGIQWIQDIGREVTAVYKLSSSNGYQALGCGALLGHLDLTTCYGAFAGDLGSSPTLSAQVELSSYALTLSDATIADGQANFSYQGAIPSIPLSINTTKILQVPKRTLNNNWRSADSLVVTDAMGNRLLYDIQMTLACSANQLSGTATLTKDFVNQTVPVTGWCYGENSEIHFQAELIPGNKTDYVINVSEIGVIQPDPLSKVPNLVLVSDLGALSGIGTDVTKVLEERTKKLVGEISLQTNFSSRSF